MYVPAKSGTGQLDPLFAYPQERAIQTGLLLLLLLYYLLLHLFILLYLILHRHRFTYFFRQQALLHEREAYEEDARRQRAKLGERQAQMEAAVTDAQILCGEGTLRHIVKRMAERNLQWGISLWRRHVVGLRMETISETLWSVRLRCMDGGACLLEASREKAILLHMTRCISTWRNKVAREEAPDGNGDRSLVLRWGLNAAQRRLDTQRIKLHGQETRITSLSTKLKVVRGEMERGTQEVERGKQEGTKAMYQIRGLCFLGGCLHEWRLVAFAGAIRALQAHILLGKESERSEEMIARTEEECFKALGQKEDAQVQLWLQKHRSGFGILRFVVCRRIEVRLRRALVGLRERSKEDKDTLERDSQSRTPTSAGRSATPSRSLTPGRAPPHSQHLAMMMQGRQRSEARKMAVQLGVTKLIHSKRTTQKCLLAAGLVRWADSAREAYSLECISGAYERRISLLEIEMSQGARDLLAARHLLAFKSQTYLAGTLGAVLQWRSNLEVDDQRWMLEKAQGDIIALEGRWAAHKLSTQEDLALTQEELTLTQEDLVRHGHALKEANAALIAAETTKTTHLLRIDSLEERLEGESSDRKKVKSSKEILEDTWKHTKELLEEEKEELEEALEDARDKLEEEGAKATFEKKSLQMQVSTLTKQLTII